MRADLKWHRYEPAPEVNRIEKFLEIVGEDKYFFWINGHITTRSSGRDAKRPAAEIER